LFFLFAALPLFSQETPPPPAGDASSPTGDASPIGDGDTTLYVIAAYEFSVKGRSRPSALLYKLIDHGEFREGEIITGKANLEKYISDITQIYTNQRVLKNNVEVSYSLGDQNEAGAFPATIMIKVEDSWNIIALPRPYYKNDVFDLTIKARDYNFLGTMQPLRIDLGYNYNEDKQHSFLFGVYFNTPFKFLGYYWNFTFDNTVQYRVDAPVYYQNKTGISMDLPFHTTTFTFGIDETLLLNDENSDWAKDNGYGPYQDGLYMFSNLYVSWKVPTSIMVSRFGELTYNPGISATFVHELPPWPLDDHRKGTSMSFSHSLSFGKTDWHANYREGLSVSISNSYSYNFNQMLYGISLDFTGTGHHIISDFFAVSARFIYKYWYSSDETYEGEYASYYLRGVADKSITAFQMFSLNLDLPFRLFIFKPSEWLKNQKLSFFDFEMHASPVIDLALYYEKHFDLEKERTMFYPGHTAVAGGLELVVFPLFMRNLYVRFGFAVNLKELLTARPVKLPDGDNREIYLIMGHFY
jgi:hypothetical protein